MSVRWKIPPGESEEDDDQDTDTFCGRQYEQTLRWSQQCVCPKRGRKRDEVIFTSSSHTRSIRLSTSYPDVVSARFSIQTQVQAGSSRNLPNFFENFKWHPSDSTHSVPRCFSSHVFSVTCMLLLLFSSAQLFQQARGEFCGDFCVQCELLHVFVGGGGGMARCSPCHTLTHAPRHQTTIHHSPLPTPSAVFSAVFHVNSLPELCIRVPEAT
nr:uncharacterized protein LOC128696378 [Cherax quadricarinatus]